MKKLITLFLLGLALSSPSLQAGEKNGNASRFWERLIAKVESLTLQKNLDAITVTDRSNGATSAAEDLYWKIGTTAQAVGSDELALFKNAIELSVSVDKAQAQTAFSEFIKQFPGSPLRKDADQALALLQNTKTAAR